MYGSGFSLRFRMYVTVPGWRERICENQPISVTQGRISESKFNQNHVHTLKLRTRSSATSTTRVFSRSSVFIDPFDAPTGHIQATLGARVCQPRPTLCFPERVLRLFLVVLVGAQRASHQPVPDHTRRPHPKPPPFHVSLRVSPRLHISRVASFVMCPQASFASLCSLRFWPNLSVLGQLETLTLPIHAAKRDDGGDGGGECGGEGCSSSSSSTSSEELDGTSGEARRFPRRRCWLVL